MVYTTADLELANRHVLLGEKHIIDQEMLITKLMAKGLDTAVAESLLSLFVDMLNIHRDRRDRIAATLH
ncbi:hypothetical protein [Rhizobium leucaenae]|uniref:Uncharacterized protein n=1 Tax=Rhizobium leucaenae TaxID=29450 RepID=A0A7W6ZXJ6_9HYPH|nr:hypothetical protein [Rhizobium leucaenae]MBB4570594.1 hypothetical protein [Rhizobium leucaenae]